MRNDVLGTLLVVFTNSKSLILLWYAKDISSASGEGSQRALAIPFTGSICY
jgi:hypothetical protein